MSVRYQLVMRSGPNPGATYSLDTVQTTLGRDASNTISINDAEVSRHHARMTLQGGKIVLEDTGSTNGTSVNGNRISGPHVLKTGEMVSLAKTSSLSLKPSALTPMQPYFLLLRSNRQRHRANSRSPRRQRLRKLMPGTFRLIPYR